MATVVWNDTSGGVAASLSADTDGHVRLQVEWLELGRLAVNNFYLEPKAWQQLVEKVKAASPPPTVPKPTNGLYVSRGARLEARQTALSNAVDWMSARTTGAQFPMVEQHLRDQILEVAETFETWLLREEKP